MSLAGKCIRDILKKYRPGFLLLAAAFAVIAAVSFLYDAAAEPLLYALLLTAFFTAVFLAVSFYREQKKAEQRERLLHSITSEWRNLPIPDTAAEEDYQQMIRLLGEQAELITEQRAREQLEAADYYATWVHQIKTPIAVMRLLLGEEDTAETAALSAELFRIEQYAEMALGYIRLGSDSNDLVVEEYELDSLIRQSIRKFAPQFIRRKIRIIYEGTTEKIVTDQKWFLCILEQLLSNAVKYTPQGSVSILVSEVPGAGEIDEKKVLLEIKDTGIGIDPADLPRIFEKGYTGINGRAGNKSTGIGLYLCKKAADKLGVTLAAESTPGEGTTFRIYM